jgi:dynein heavy chain
LAQTKNPKLIQAHIDKCFEGISKLQFNDSECIFGMISTEGEIVAYLK